MSSLRHPFAPLYVAIAGVLIAAAGVGYAQLLTAPAPAPDITVNTCDVFANGNTNIPPLTYTDRCVDTEHGNVIVYSDPSAH